MSQVALISGGGGGIGGAVAHRMARAAVTVVVADYDLDAAEASGYKIAFTAERLFDPATVYKKKFS